MTQRTLNFLEIYFEAIEENIDEVAGKLKDSGIDPEESQNRIMQKIKQRKAEIKIEKGKKLKERVKELIKKKFELIEPAPFDEDLALAYRNLSGLNSDEKMMIKKDAALLDEIEKLIAENTDEA